MIVERKAALANQDVLKNRFPKPLVKVVMIMTNLLIAWFPVPIFGNTPVGAVNRAALTLAADPSLSTDGYFNLHWSIGEELHSETQDGGEIEVRLYEISPANRPTLIYKGPDRASSISGRSNGVYRFMVALDRPTGVSNAGMLQSNTVTVRVEHHSLVKAWLYFATGSIVFLSTMAMILLGDRRYRKERNRHKEEHSNG